jgi:hypothetical protein
MQKFRKAVFIGINYPNSRSPLLNCINDAKNMRDLIRSRGGFDEHLFLSDDSVNGVAGIGDSVDTGDNHNIMPTKHNIFAAFDWLFDGVKEGDHLFIHYSGHGGSVRDPARKESDGKNETLCNCDYEKVGEIIDDELNVKLVKRAVELGVHLFVITDSCHSGSNCDERFCMKEESPKVQQQVVAPQYPQVAAQYPQYPPQTPQLPPMYPQVPMYPQFPQYPQQHQYPQYASQPYGPPPQPQYVIYQGKHYPYHVFQKRFIDPINEAAEFLKKRREHKLRMAYLPEYQRARERSRDRGLIEWFKKKLAELNEDMKTNPFIAHLMKTGIPIYPKPEYISYAVSAVNAVGMIGSIAFPPAAPIFGAISAAAQVYGNHVSASAPSAPSTPSELETPRSVRNVRETKWSNTEDSKMPKYSGKGTFLKLSGCRDEQTSADGYNDRENGAMSGAILELFEKRRDATITIGDFLFQIRSKLMMHRFEQVPQMGSNTPIDSSQILPL